MWEGRPQRYRCLARKADSAFLGVLREIHRVVVALIHSLPIPSVHTDFSTADARELYRHANKPIFLFLIVGGEGVLVHYDNRIVRYADLVEGPASQGRVTVGTAKAAGTTHDGALNGLIFPNCHPKWSSRHLGSPVIYTGKLLSHRTSQTSHVGSHFSMSFRHSLSPARVYLDPQPGLRGITDFHL